MRNSILLKWFFIWLAAMIFIAVLTLPDERPDKLEEVGFQTTESAELYFKNVRAFYYLTKEEAEGILYVYRLKSIFEDSLPSLPFAMYNNWRTNETFIRLDTAYIDLRNIRGVIVDSASVKSDTLYLPQPSNESQYIFARDVFRAIDDKERLGLLGRDKVAWITESQTTSIKRTLSDYFRLLDKI